MTAEADQQIAQGETGTILMINVSVHNTSACSAGPNDGKKAGSSLLLWPYQQLVRQIWLFKLLKIDITLDRLEQCRTLLLSHALMTRIRRFIHGSAVDDFITIPWSEIG